MTRNLGLFEFQKKNDKKFRHANIPVKVWERGNG